MFFLNCVVWLVAVKTASACFFFKLCFLACSGKNRFKVFFLNCVVWLVAVKKNNQTKKSFFRRSAFEVVYYVHSTPCKAYTAIYHKDHYRFQ